MDLKEDDVVCNSQAYLDSQEFTRMRQFIETHKSVCKSDENKQTLVRLWEDSLYREFLEKNPKSATPLSSSMRYKLRKKNPCPIELDIELRVKNARLPKNVHDGLNHWLKMHQDNPYPTKLEKDELAATLEISTQQVNRWFIQRRKMLRQRGGQLYLGRGTGSESTPPSSATNNSAQNSDDDEDFDYYDDEDFAVQQTNLRLVGGETLGGGQNHHDMLTPPASVSGEDAEMTALDLTLQLQQQQQQQQAIYDHHTQQYPVILEQVQPHWKPSNELFFFKGEKSKVNQQQSHFDEAEIEAAKALVYMGNKNKDL